MKTIGKQRNPNEQVDELLRLERGRIKEVKLQMEKELEEEKRIR